MLKLSSLKSGLKGNHPSKTANIMGVDVALNTSPDPHEHTPYSATE